MIEGGIPVDVLTALSLHGGLAAAWPVETVTTDMVLEALVTHWGGMGLPPYEQFDNDKRFQGAHQFWDAIGRVTRLCLNLGVIPVFTPVQEHGFQAALEAFNGRWHGKVWHHFHHESVAGLQVRSIRHIVAHRHQAARRHEMASPRPFPTTWRFDPLAPPCGQIIFLRRTSALGTVALLGHAFPVDSGWPHHLVRYELHLEAKRIWFYALRRREPTAQPLLHEVPDVSPDRKRDRVASR